MLKETAVTIYRKKTVLEEFPNLVIKGADLRILHLKLTLPLPKATETKQDNHDYVSMTVELPNHEALFTLEGNDYSVLPKMLEQVQRLLPTFSVPQNISLYTEK